MKYIRKTEDEWVIQQCGAEGWEDVTCEETRRGGRARLKEYRANQPEIAARMIYRRVKIEGGKK